VCTGVREFLEQLREHEAVLGLVTGNLSEIGWKKVELAGLRDYFSVGAFSEDGHTRAELARIAAERARTYCEEIQRCLITLIGDHANDIEAAKANGFRSVAVATGVSSADELEKFSPDILVRDLRELTVAKLMDRARVRGQEEQPQPST
jgi:phosphoglycolate phosphatase-like HAD superfamily hydrolase